MISICYGLKPYLHGKASSNHSKSLQGIERACSRSSQLQSGNSPLAAQMGSFSPRAHRSQQLLPQRHQGLPHTKRSSLRSTRSSKHSCSWVCTNGRRESRHCSCWSRDWKPKCGAEGIQRGRRLFWRHFWPRAYCSEPCNTQKGCSQIGMIC